MENDDNNNEEFDFSSVPTLSEMKAKRMEGTGGDIMHELQREPVNENENTHKNDSYNDLTNLHKNKIKNDGVIYEEVSNDTINNGNNNIENDSKKKTIIIIAAVVGIVLIFAIIRLVIISKMINNQNGVLKRPSNNLVSITIEKEEMYEKL